MIVIGEAIQLEPGDVLHAPVKIVASRKNIAAFTSTDMSAYPDFVSINEEDGRVSIAVRSDNSKNYATIVMPADEFSKLADSIAAWRAQK